MLISLTLAPLVKTQLKSEFLPILLRVNAYQFCIPFCFSTEQNRTNRVNWVRLGSVIELNQTHKKSSSSIMFDCRTNWTIGFDWFLVQFRSIDYAGYESKTKLWQKRIVDVVHFGQAQVRKADWTKDTLNTTRPCYFFASRNHSLAKLINCIKRKLKKHAMQGTVCMFKWTFDLTLQRET